MPLFELEDGTAYDSNGSKLCMSDKSIGFLRKTLIGCVDNMQDNGQTTTQLEYDIKDILDEIRKWNISQSII